MRALQRAVYDIYVDPSLVSYAVALATATREPAEHGLADLAPYVSYGASPRGPISLVQATRALALIRGREYAIVDAEDGHLSVDLRRIDFDVDTLLGLIRESGMPHADWWAGLWFRPPEAGSRRGTRESQRRIPGSRPGSSG